MPRFARIVVPGLARHVTQRGNRRGPIFFEPGDQEVYRDLLAEQALKARVAVWAWLADRFELGRSSNNIQAPSMPLIGPIW